MRVAFLGLGTMGGGMAARLADAGVPLTVWNRRRDRTAPFAARGVRVADSPADAARDADVIMSMVADDRASQAVWIDDGALAAAKRGALLIESSTLSPDWIEQLAALASARGCDFLDAPVTGSRTHAANGQLLFLVGGDVGAFARVRPLLAAMSRDALHLGPIGSGARLKLVNNFLCGVQAASLAEAIAMLERTNLNRDAALSVLSQGAPGSPLVAAVTPRMTTPDYTVNFALALMHKDLSYAVAEARRLGLTLTTASAAQQRFQDALDAGFSDQDFSAVIEPIRSKP